MKINVDVPSQVVTIDGVSRTVVGLLPEYVDIEFVEFDVAASDGVITYKSRSRAPDSITSIATLQTAVARWAAAKPTHESVWQDVKAKREAVNFGGVLVGGYWFYTDSKAAAQYSMLYAAVAVNSLPNTYVFSPVWKTMSGKKVPMTVALLKAIVGMGIRNEIANHANAERHNEALFLASNPGEYDFSTGWTKVYT